MGAGSDYRILEQLPFTWRLNNALVSYIEYVREHSGRRDWPFSTPIRTIHFRSGRLPWRARFSSLFLQWRFSCERNVLMSLPDGSGMSVCWCRSSGSFRLANKDTLTVIPTASHRSLSTDRLGSSRPCKNVASSKGVSLACGNDNHRSFKLRRSCSDVVLEE